MRTSRPNLLIPPEPLKRAPMAPNPSSRKVKITRLARPTPMSPKQKLARHNSFHESDITKNYVAAQRSPQTNRSSFIRSHSNMNDSYLNRVNMDRSNVNRLSHSNMSHSNIYYGSNVHSNVHNRKHSLLELPITKIGSGSSDYQNMWYFKAIAPSPTRTAMILEVMMRIRRVRKKTECISLQIPQFIFFL